MKGYITKDLLLCELRELIDNNETLEKKSEHVKYFIGKKLLYSSEGRLFVDISTGKPYTSIFEKGFSEYDKQVVTWDFPLYLERKYITEKEVNLILKRAEKTNNIYENMERYLISKEEIDDLVLELMISLHK